MIKQSWIPTPLCPEAQRPAVVLAPRRAPVRWRSLWVLRRSLRMLLDVRPLLRSKVSAVVVTRSRRIREFLEEMGGLWIKCGQLIALRRDIFSSELCAELSRLHDRVQGFEFEEVRAVVEEKLGQPIDAVFEEFDPKPIAAASIGQVHRARLRGKGRKVVVKIQRPDAKELFVKDLVLIRLFIVTLVVLRVLPHIRWDGLREELERIIDEELDYRHEAGALRRMRKLLKPHKIIVPKVHVRYCTELMITMDALEGAFASDVLVQLQNDPVAVNAWFEQNQINPKKVANRLLLSTMRQIFEDNLFHGDLHPGNIVLFKKSRVGLIDFGSVGSFEPTFTAKYRSYLLAFAAGEYERAADMLLALSERLPILDLPAVRRDLAKAMRRWAEQATRVGVPFHERSLANASNEMNPVMVRYKIEPNWSLLKVSRSISTLDATLSHLHPDLNYIKTMRRYGQQSRFRVLAGMLRRAAGLPHTIEQYVALAGPVVRERLLNYIRVAGKTWSILAILFRIFQVAAGAALIAVMAAFLKKFFRASALQSGVDTVTDRVVGHSVMERVTEAIRLPREGWMLLVAGLTILLLIFGAMIRIAKAPERKP